MKPLPCSETLQNDDNNKNIILAKAISEIGKRMFEEAAAACKDRGVGTQVPRP